MKISRYSKLSLAEIVIAGRCSILAFGLVLSYSVLACLPLAVTANAQITQLSYAQAFCLSLEGDDGIVACPKCRVGEGRALVFVRGAERDSTPSPVCLSNLGVFNPETGALVSSNYDPVTRRWYLNGKFLQTRLQSLAPSVGRFAAAGNDFTLNPAGTLAANARQSTLWSSEAHLYYYINDYRVRIIPDSFVDSLGLPNALATNVKFRQFRPDLQGIVNARLPWTTPVEAVSFTPWTSSAPLNELTSPSKQRTQISDPLDSLAFDPEYVIAQYTGVMSNWLAASNSQWPNNPTWGQVGNLSWRTDIRPAILEGFKLWNAYRMSQQNELMQYAARVQRRWSNYSCGGTGQAPCNKGRLIRNVMMYLDTADPALNNPTNGSWPATASDDTLLFPYGTNYAGTLGGVRSGVGSGVEHFGPRGAELGGMFIGALFYDLANEAGLGQVSVDRLFWKTISLIDPGQPIDMTTFATRVQQAARALFPTTANPNLSWYEQDIVDVFASRGVRMNGATDFLANIPAPLGVTANQGPGALLTANAVGLGSSIPESQRNSTTGYNFLSFFQNGYQVTTPGTQYVTYQFYKHSKYGPCDALDLTNGTFNIPSGTANPIMNFDGSVSAPYTDRSLGNTLVMAPGDTIRFLRRRQSCVNEQDGYYAEDVRPFGFRVIKAIPNGFTFRVARTGVQSNGRIRYTLTIVDPSLTLTGPNTGPASYSWQFTEFNNSIVNASGQSVIYDALQNQPFTISVTRTRGAQNDNITLRERGNDLDRNGGNQFNQDYWNPGYNVGFDTIIGRRLVTGHGSYNSALNPVDGAFGVQARRWTTPSSLVQPLRFSTVSHGIGSGSNQNGPYYFENAVYYEACIWGTRQDVTNAPGCTQQGTGNFSVEVPFANVGISLGNPFAIVTAGSYPGYLWTVNYPSTWRLNPNTEYHFGSHISASVVNNGYSYNVCSYAPAAWDGTTAGNAADRSDWLAGANWSGANGAPPPQTMRQYLSSAGSVSGCTHAAYRFEGKTVTQ